MKWNLRLHQISEQESRLLAVWSNLKQDLFPLRFVTCLYDHVEEMWLPGGQGLSMQLCIPQVKQQKHLKALAKT